MSAAAEKSLRRKRKKSPKRSRKLLKNSLQRKRMFMSLRRTRKKSPKFLQSRQKRKKAGPMTGKIRVRKKLRSFSMMIWKMSRPWIF